MKIKVSSVNALYVYALIADNQTQIQWPANKNPYKLNSE